MPTQECLPLCLRLSPTCWVLKTLVVLGVMCGGKPAGPGCQELLLVGGEAQGPVSSCVGGSVSDSLKTLAFLFCFLSVFGALRAYFPSLGSNI